jgi:PAS domain S-box-containing protein
MKILNHAWVKYAQLNQMKLELSRKKEQMVAALEFVKDITQGNLDGGLKLAGHDGAENELANSLVNMRDQMKKISTEEKQRHWVTEGLAKFADILRHKNSSLSALSDTIIRNLVKYLGANQGALYLVNDENPADVFIDMAACYAYERKKHFNQRIELGEGMTGQVALEKTTLYMTSVPQNYIKITSGLGEALPKNLLIIPVKLEDKIFGLVEIASFEVIMPHQIAFVERLGESIASTISAVKVNEKTQQLLRETQTQTEQLRAQEEEMRQSMEELTATQEEMQRILKEVQGQERYMTELINSSTDSILVIDTSYCVVSANNTLKHTYATLGIDVVKGLEVSKLFDGTDWPKYKSYYDRTFEGESFQRTELFQSHGFELYFISQHTPIRDNTGKVVASAVFAKDVTELVKAQKTAEKLGLDQQEKNEELKAQEEELRQNMEELSTTQDEMQRIILEIQSKEKYLSDIINLSNDIIFTVDREYKIISFNSAMENGMSRIGVRLEKGYCLLDIFTGDQRSIQKNYYDRAFEGESYDRVEHFTANELDSYSVVSYAPLKNEQREIYGVAVFSKDITDTHRTLEEVKRKELELNEIINASVDSIWTTDLQCKLVAFNKKFIEVFAARQITVAPGMDLIDVLQEHERAPQRSIYDRVFAGDRFEITQTFTFGGVDVHVLVTYSPLRNDREEVTGAAVYAKDVTATVNTQKQHEHMMKMMQNQNEDYRVQEERFLQSVRELELMKRNVLELKMREDAYAQTICFAELDANGRILEVNSKLIEVCGFRRNEIIGKRYTLLNATPRELVNVCNKHLAKGKLWKGILKNINSKGSCYWVDVTMIPVTDETGIVCKIHISGYPIENDSLGKELYREQATRLGLRMSVNNGEENEGTKTSLKKRAVPEKFHVNKKAA